MFNIILAAVNFILLICIIRLLNQAKALIDCKCRKRWEEQIQFNSQQLGQNTTQIQINEESNRMRQLQIDINAGQIGWNNSVARKLGLPLIPTF